MRAVISVTGKDVVGILAQVSGACACSNANIVEVSQTVMRGLFAMIMMVDTTNLNCPITEFRGKLESLGEKLGLSVHVMHEEIFASMHNV